MRKMMLIAVVLVGFVEMASAQFIKAIKSPTPAATRPQPVKRYPLDWYMLSFQTDSVYGIELNNAREFLEANGKEKKKKVVVAVIDSGCDDLHEDLKEVLWVNNGEIAGNGIDDDRNGYVDDVHGWSFLGNQKGVNVEILMEASARELAGMKDRYEGLCDKDKLTPAEKAELDNMQFMLKTSQLGSAYVTAELGRLLLRKFEALIQIIEAVHPPEKITSDLFFSFTDDSYAEDENMKLAQTIYSMRWQSMRGDWQSLKAGREAIYTMSKKKYEDLLPQMIDQRDQVGDDIHNLKDCHYGNNVLSTRSAEHGTHVGSIIGSRQGNGIGIDGIADVELMFVRAIPQIGDEYDKDVALAIRYAVDNGAHIINMSFGKFVTTDKKWVDDALRYAEKKGVLVVHAAGNSFMDNDIHPFYPSKYVSKKKAISTFITVGASDPKGRPVYTSCYGQKSVDVFAPGIDIYGATPGDNYKTNGGTSLATPMVSGIAALLMTYYPELSARQVKEIILECAVGNRNKEVPLPQGPKGVAPKMVSLGEICVSGGIVSALEALRLAEEKTK